MAEASIPRPPLPSIHARRTQTGTRPGEAPEPFGAPPARPRRRRERRRGARGRRDRDHAAGAARAARVGRRPPRPDELRQDLPRARSAQGARPRRLRGAAADARPGGAPQALGRAGGGRASVSSPARSESTTRPRSSAAPSRWRRARARCSCSTRCSGPTTPSAARPGRGSCSRATTATSSCSARSMPSRSSCNAFPEAEVKVFERILPLEFVGERSLRGLTPGTVVVAFSRKAVLALAGEINRLHPDRVSVLYGAMPLSSRREEIDRFLSGRSDVTVATDVLGHGVNLPCETLLFAETTKFDGESRRDLLPWELAQIAGRAGRFGLVERGHVGVLTGVPWANADPEIVEEALQPHVRAAVGAPRLPHRRRGADQAAARRPRRRRPAPPRRGARRLASRRDARLGARGLARRRVAEPDPRQARRDPAPARRPQPPPVDRGHLEADQRPGRRGQRRAALDAGARARRAIRPSGRCSPSCSTRPGCATRRSRRQSKLDEPQASCAGSRCSTRASAASRSSGRPSSRRPPRHASSRACASR